MKNIEYENIEFIIGENANENWELLDYLRQINDEYIWFHLNSFPSPYVIMKSSLIEIDKDRQNEY